MIVDANVLIYAVDEASPFHVASRRFLTERLNGIARVGLPWQSLLAFHRIATLPRVLARPLSPPDAWSLVEGWLDAPSAWIPVPTEHHREVLRDLIGRYHIGGKLVPDADLAALAIEHGVPVASADTGFARFTEVRWINPLAAA